MPNYQISKIYKIINDVNTNFYIGSTSQKYLCTRMAHHRHKHNNCMSKKIGVDLKECFIILVENFPCNTKEELLKRERYYIEKYKKEGLNIVNKYIPLRTGPEYYQDTKEKHKKECKKYRETHKEKIKAKTKIWREKNKEKIKEQRKKFYDENKEILLKKKKDYHKKNKEKMKKYKKEWYLKNKERISIKNKKKYDEKKNI